ncbi:MAG: PucR family transcriptional regulator [Actinomycetaceae bacterium]|nr:PucR family transcriptional regulator [Actinomycetaceae bacterium]MDY6082954.1 PucR family transcriptional regulator [Actinomycetaceae bacterium]
MYSGVTVRRVLQHPEFEGAHVLAGAENLDKPVESVTVAEIPDIAHWLNGNDFVHGVGSFFGQANGTVDEAALLQWVRDLIDGGAACLALKTHRYINEVPQSVLQLGDEEGFPIIELPEGVIQARISSIVFQMISEAEQAREQRRTKLFTDMVRDLSGPHVLSHDAERMAVYLHHPVAILSADFDFLGTSFDGGDSDIDVSELGRNVKKAITAGDTLEQVAVTEGQTIYSLQARDSYGVGYQLVATDIVYAGENLGYVCMVGAEKPLSNEDIYFFASLAEVLTIDMSQHAMVETSSLTSRRDFFAAISEPQMDERRALHLADLIGLNYVQPMRIAIISFSPQTGNFTTESSFFGEQERRAMNTVSQQLHSILGSEETLFVCPWERGVAIIFTEEKHTPERYSEIVESVVNALSAAPAITDVIAGIGQAGSGIAGIHQSAENAFYAVKCIELFSLSEKVIRYDELGSYLFLSAALCSADASREYVDFILGALLNQESQYRDELLETLEVYLKVNGSYAAAAKELYVHVNTVRYRIAKIAELLPVDLTSSDGKGAIWLAMRINKILTKGSPATPRCK